MRTGILKEACAVALLLGLTPAHAADIGSAAKFAAKMPVEFASFCTGAVFGTPIAVARKTAQNSVKATKDASGNSDNKGKLAAASLIGLPVGIFTGSIEGVYWGLANSWTNSSKPFSKDAFSLGEMKD